jgi:hypothetical protein
VVSILKFTPFYAWILICGVALCGFAQSSPAASTPAPDVAGWFDRVEQTQAEQPHWITPLVTVTPRLEEEFRYDFFHEEQPGGARTDVYGAGKGLELIPARRVEIILGVPAYFVHRPAPRLDGWGDTSFLVKYRLLSSNEEQKNYILTLFFAASIPTATNGNGAGHAVFTPTLAAGKGWGHFDVQSTFGVAIPSGALSRLGSPLTWNTAFQYRVLRKLWPELEMNSTFWPNGSRSGKNQIFLTPGLMVGRLHLWKRTGLTFGAGMQIAATRFHTYNHNLILSLRLPF